MMNAKLRDANVQFKLANPSLTDLEAVSPAFAQAMWSKTRTRIVLSQPERQTVRRRWTLLAGRGKAMARLTRVLKLVSGPILVALAQLVTPSFALAGRLSGTLNQTNTELREFIQGDIATLVMLCGFCAAGWTLVTKRMGFGWACTVFIVGVVMKNLVWLIDLATDLSGTLR